MVKRRLDDWLTSYLEFTDNSESPVSYHTWAGMSCIASSLQRRVYMRWGHSDIYPNLYILLVGPSGHGRKGEPIVIAKWILNELNLVVIEEDITEEALIVQMKLAETYFMDESKNKFKYMSAVTVCAEEMAVFVGQQNTRLLSYLTNWYDSRDKWSRRTKSSTTEEIYGVCFNLLASTAPDWFSYIFSHEAVGGGFTSRCLFVVEERKRKSVPLPNKTRPSEQLKVDLIHDLEIINYINGEFHFEPEAEKIYEDWYLSQDNIILKEKRLILGEPTLQGYESRRATLVKKIAMCLSVSYKDELIITKEDFERSLKMMNVTEKKMPAAFKGFGRSKYAEDTEDIIAFIRAHKTVKRSVLMSTFYRNLDDAAFDSIMSVLEKMKIVRVSVLTSEGDRSYTYEGKEST